MTLGAASTDETTGSAHAGRRRLSHGASPVIAPLRFVRFGTASLLWRPRMVALGVILVVAVVAAFALHLAFGGTAIDYGAVVRALLGDTSDPFVSLAITEFRAPRAVAAVIVGACLAVAGAITQTVARNPLASPDILGVTSGAAFGAVSVLVIAGGGAGGLSGAAALVGMPTAAFVAGLISGIAVYVLAYRRGIDSFRLVLVGLGVSGLATSLTTWLLTLGDVTNAAQAMTWMAGSLNGKDWSLVAPMGIAAVVLLLLGVGVSRVLTVASLGDDTAIGLGMRLGPVRLVALTLAVLLASLATVIAGPVAFVALAAPQIARLLAGSATPPILVSGLVGMLFVLTADTLSANLFGLALPVGVGTAVLGAPYLIWLLLNSQRKTA